MRSPVYYCIIIAFLMCNFIKYSSTAKILGLFPTPSISHQIVYQALCKELSLRGHRVTVFTPNPLNNQSLVNLTEKDVSYLYKYSEIATSFIKWSDSSLMEPFFYLYYIKTIGITFLEDFLNNGDLQEIINNENENFDLIIVEMLFPALAAFSQKLRCPFIGISSLDPGVFIHDAIGNPSHPVLNPAANFPISNEPDFIERLLSTLYTNYHRFVHYHYMNEYDRLVKTYIGTNLPELKKIISKISLLLVNVNPLHNVRPNVPAVINFSGMHLENKKQETLSDDLKYFLDNATEGVVYMSLGCNVELTLLKGTNKVLEMIEALAELPYKVLLKWNPKVKFPVQSHNIKYAAWFPQFAILKHPNVKVFISQGGLQSTEEAIMNAVPIIAMSFYGDQHITARKIESFGLGKQITPSTFNKLNFKRIIIEVSTEKTYKDEMNTFSKIFKDDSIASLNKAVWWTEYVMKHEGAFHLRSPLADLPWYKYLLLDVIVVVTGIMVCLLYVICKVCSCGYRKKLESN